MIDKVLLKAATKAGQKKDRVFTLRGIDTSKVLACDDLKKLIKRQLDDDVIEWEEFDIGYSQQKQSGGFSCDTTCPNWNSTGFCSHTVTVAEVNGSTICGISQEEGQSA